MIPSEPPACVWDLPDPATAPPGEELLGVGADLAPGTLLAAYRRGLFPMPVDPDGARIGWWSPDPRGVLPLERVRVTRSLRASCRRFEVGFDEAFDDVVAACADPRRPHGWITPGVRAAYGALHRLGWAHSVEVRSPQGELVGGLYGVEVGGLFAGESMFHRARDASKVALVALADRLRDADGGARLLDVQWATPHLESMGVVPVPRSVYLLLLGAALPLPPAFGPAPRTR